MHLQTVQYFFETGFFALRTAIAAVVIATAVVVVVITVSVTHICFGTTLAIALLLLFRVNARAVFAVISFDHLAFHASGTAVTAIIVALLNVVSVITVAIAFVGRQCAANFGFRVQAFAHFTVVFFDGWTAAVTTIPTTVLVVVLVVAVFIALVSGKTA